MVRRVLAAVPTLLGWCLGMPPSISPTRVPGLLTTKPVAAPPGPDPWWRDDLGWQLADPTAPLDAVATAAPQPAPKKLAALPAPAGGLRASGRPPSSSAMR